MKINRFCFLAVLLAMILIAGCSSDRKDWQTAQTANTIDALNAYLAEHPEGTFADSAKAQIEALQLKIYERQRLAHARALNLIPVYRAFLTEFPQSIYTDSIQFWIAQICSKRHPEFSSSRTVKVKVLQDFEEHALMFVWRVGHETVLEDDHKIADRALDPQEIPFDVKRDAEQMLLAAGLSLPEADSEAADVTLQIDLRGQALSAAYTGELVQLYTGGALSGTIAFQTSGGFVDQESFESRTDPPLMLFDSGLPKTPAAAPWREVFESFYDKFVDMVYDLFGANALISALYTNNQVLVEKLKDKIIEIKDPDASLTLLSMVNDMVQNQRLVRSAVGILGELRTPRAVEPLIALLNADNYATRWEAGRALMKITGQNFDIDRAKWQAWWDANKGNF